MLHRVNRPRWTRIWCLFSTATIHHRCISCFTHSKKWTRHVSNSEIRDSIREIAPIHSNRASNKVNQSCQSLNRTYDVKLRCVESSNGCWYTHQVPNLRTIVLWYSATGISQINRNIIDWPSICMAQPFDMRCRHVQHSLPSNESPFETLKKTASRRNSKIDNSN